MSVLTRLKENATALRNELPALFLAMKNPVLPLLPKVLLILTVGYALSPIDLIPDFIPVLGLLDDLIILPALMALVIRLIPNEIMEESRAIAKSDNIHLSKNRFASLIILLIWVFILYFIFKALFDSGIFSP